MLSNFKKQVGAQYHPVASHSDCQEQINDLAMPSEMDNVALRLPSSRSVVQVLYPPSYLGIPSTLHDPPSYPAQEDNAKMVFLLVSSTTTNGHGTHSSRSDPLAEDPSLTGVPYNERFPSFEPNPPIVDYGDDVDSEETELLPAYSRFDQRRPRFPAASDVFGPYPPLSVLREAAG